MASSSILRYVTQALRSSVLLRRARVFAGRLRLRIFRPTRLHRFGGIRTCGIREVVVERREYPRISERGSETDVAIRADQDQAARGDASLEGIDRGVARDLHPLEPPSGQLCQCLGAWDGSKNEQVVGCPAEARPVGVAPPGMRLPGVGRAFPVVGDEEITLVSAALERLAHRLARDAVCSTRADDEAGVDSLETAILVGELD